MRMSASARTEYSVTSAAPVEWPPAMNGFPGACAAACRAASTTAAYQSRQLTSVSPAGTVP